MATPAGIEGSGEARETPSKAAIRDEGRGEEASAGVVSRGYESPDEALRAAIHAAVDAGLYDRAKALLELLAGGGLGGSQKCLD